MIFENLQNKFLWDFCKKWRHTFYNYMLGKILLQIMEFLSIFCGLKMTIFIVALVLKLRTFMVYLIF